jgi:hypothetical protein
LREALAPHPLHYLALRDIPAGPRWRHFVQAMGGEVQHETQIEDACAGAVDAFDRLTALVSPLRGRINEAKESLEVERPVPEQPKTCDAVS